MGKGLAVVAGGGGFIGGHLAKDLMNQGYEVRVVDIKPMEQWYQVHPEAHNVVADLQLLEHCRDAVKGASRVYQLAADMGGMGFIENNKALCMLSVMTNTHMLVAARDEGKIDRFFYSSSACVYNADKQVSEDVVPLKEADAYPAMPEDGYGWEKLFSERMCRHFCEDYGLETRVARFHNVYGPFGTWEGGREKAPAAITRKIIEAKTSGNHTVEVWGDGKQTRSFMYIDDCVKGINKFTDGPHIEPLNLGSDELTTINGLTDMVAEIAGIEIERSHKLDAPKGVNGRNSDNTLIKQHHGWAPEISLRDGMERTYNWIWQEFVGKYGAGKAAAATA
ncbi:MAG: NAD-dependent epimerase/dehydratase family protein [Planctomycetota bacterium]